jgi:hypothetical protein
MTSVPPIGAGDKEQYILTLPDWAARGISLSTLGRLSVTRPQVVPPEAGAVTIIGVLHGDMHTGLVRRRVAGEQSTAARTVKLGSSSGSSTTQCPYTGI